ncbi:MAG: PxxKW family cysteine-rich protein [Deltaproteobacteria bacterium]|nr:PxxKW family cysteine-rich protein [Deltaproteobacteria bacterium]
MDCLTIKNGAECIFMGKNGCSFNGGSCHAIVEECNGCGRAVEFATGWFCSTCPDPATKWKNGKCNFATHVKKESQQGTIKINPLKASKRKTR